MTWSWENREEGYMLSTLIDPWLLYPLINSLKGLKYALTWPRWKNTLGVMIKLKDDVSGGVFPNGKISKPMTDHDRPRMRAAEVLELAKQKSAAEEKKCAAIDAGVPVADLPA